MSESHTKRGTPADPGDEALISIVVPAYKADRYLPEALDGVASQALGDWELIVVEDASHDQTQRMVTEFASSHPRHRVIYVNTEVNGGQGRARNIGMSMARGRFLALLDADDKWLPDHLVASLQRIQEEKADIVYSTVVLFDDATGAHIGRWGREHDDPEDIQEALCLRSLLSPSATLIRMSCIRALNGFSEKEELRNVEDYDFWLRAAGGGYRFAHVHGALCLYRKGHSEAGTRDTATLNRKIAAVLESRIDTLENLSPTLRNTLLGRRQFISGMNNVRFDVDYARSALEQACRNRPENRIYRFARFAIRFPRMFAMVLAAVEPMAGPFRKRFSRH